MVRGTRHLWVGNLPDNAREEKVLDHFQRYGRIESVKILPKRSSEGGRAAFVDFVDIRSAQKAHEAVNRMGDRELRTDYNEPGSATSLARAHGHTDSVPSSPTRNRRFERRGEGSTAYSSQHHSYDDYSPEEEAGGEIRISRSSSRGRYNGRRGRGRGGYSRQYQQPQMRHRQDNYQSRRPSGHPHDSDSEGGSRSQSRSVSSDRSSSDGSSSDSGSESERSASPGSETSRIKGSGGTSTALCVKNLSTRSSDASIKEGLYHEFKKQGEVVRIQVHSQGAGRYAVLYFRRGEDVEKAILGCQGKMFLGTELDLSVWHEDHPESSDDYFPPPRQYSEYGPDDYEHLATKTLFVGNIERATNFNDLKAAFERYGEIIDIDIKKGNGNMAYAFIQFADLSCAMQARKRMDREFIGRNRVKVGFGKGQPTTTVWLGNVPSSFTVQQLQRHFQRFGRVRTVALDKYRAQCMITFDIVDDASYALSDVKARGIFNRRVKSDYASRDGFKLFHDALQKSGQLSRSATFEQPQSTTYNRPSHNKGAYDKRGSGPRGTRGGRGRDRHGHFQQYDSGYDGYQENSAGFQGREQRQYRGNDEYYGYDSDDYGQELINYNFSRQREREREREHVGRSGRDREKGDSDDEHSGSERYYPDQERFHDDRSSGGSDTGDEGEINERREKHAKRRTERSEKSRHYVEERRGNSVKKSEEFEDDRSEKRRKSKGNKSKYGSDYEEGVEKSEKVREEFEEGPKRRQKYESLEEKPEEKNKSEKAQEIFDNESKDAAVKQEPEDIVVSKQKKKRKKHKHSHSGDGEEGKKHKRKHKIKQELYPEVDMEEKQADDLVENKEKPVQERLDVDDDGKGSNHQNEESEALLPEKNSDTRMEPEHPYRSPKKRFREEIADRERIGSELESKAKLRKQGDSPPPPPPPPPPPTEQKFVSPVSAPAHAHPAFPAIPPSQPSHIPTSYGQPPDPPPVMPVSVPAIPYEGGSSLPGTPPQYQPSPTRIPPPVLVPPIPGVPPSTETYELGTPPSAPLPAGSAPAYNPSQPSNADTLLELLRRYPVMWQGLLALKNDTAAVQMHYLSGNTQLAENSLPQMLPGMASGSSPLRIAQRMRLEPSQLEGVARRMQSESEHCLLLALPCGRDPLDVHTQTRALKSAIIVYLQQKQAAGIINIARPGSNHASYVLHIFPPCEFSQEHLAKTAPDLLDSAADSGHLMVVVATV